MNNNIEDVLSRTDIVDVIGSYIPLKRAGSNFKAPCPFHDEKTASFVVSEKKQIFKCFGCGVAGNAITFVRDYEKISFYEALKKLAERAGVKLQNDRQNPEKKSQHDILYLIYQKTNNFFRDNLVKHGSFARDYLESRSVSKETIEKLELGYSLNSYTALYNHLFKNKFNPNDLLKSGLFNKSANGTIDVFRDRLMFPIHSITGKIVAFGGRILHKQENTGKYVNSPTTDIYTKGNELYGLYFTRYNISRKKQVLICEGYMDYLRLYETGFTNVVASLGTSLTSKQISLLERYTSNFYMIYDGDKAGIKAAVRASIEILKRGLVTKIITLPDQEDPDSFLVKHGKDELQKYIDNAIDFFKFLENDKILAYTEKNKIELLLDSVQEIKDPVSREIIIKEISEIFSLSSNSLLSKLNQKKHRYKKKDEPSTVTNELNKYLEERSIIKILLNDVNSHKKVAQELKSDYFLSEIYKKIFENVLYQLHDEMKKSMILELFEDAEVQNVVAGILLEDHPELLLANVIRDIKLRKYKDDLEKIDVIIQKDKNNLELKSERKVIIEKISELSPKVVRKTLYKEN
ncbi:MAG: DNA primase [Candidatus Cloacimonetes bacterium]|nr:DNA primase [Candidatus Cloacimonadota bacterium]